VAKRPQSVFEQLGLLFIECLLQFTQRVFAQLFGAGPIGLRHVETVNHYMGLCELFLKGIRLDFVHIEAKALNAARNSRGIERRKVTIVFFLPILFLVCAPLGSLSCGSTAAAAINQRLWCAARGSYQAHCCAKVSCLSQVGQQNCGRNLINTCCFSIGRCIKRIGSS
jgi:hypothetical protein